MSIEDITDTSEKEQDSEDDQVKRQEKEITAKYCKKCKKSFISGIRACENSKCLSWVCDSCLPTNYEKHTEFFVTKNALIDNFNKFKNSLFSFKSIDQFNPYPRGKISDFFFFSFNIS
jgi:hypothetical protein